MASYGSHFAGSSFCPFSGWLAISSIKGGYAIYINFLGIT